MAEESGFWDSINKYSNQAVDIWAKFKATKTKLDIAKLQADSARAKAQAAANGNTLKPPPAEYPRPSLFSIGKGKYGGLSAMQLVVIGVVVLLLALFIRMKK